MADTKRETKSEFTQKPGVPSYAEVVKERPKFSTSFARVVDPLPWLEPHLTVQPREVPQLSPRRVLSRQIIASSRFHGLSGLEGVPRTKVGQTFDEYYEVEKLNSDVSVSGRRRWQDSLNIPVLWSGDVYMIDNPDKLLKYSISRDFWSVYILPCEAKERLYWDSVQQVHTLTTYDSKLLLISADSVLLWKDKVLSFKMWELDATTSTFKPLPDMTPPLSMRIGCVQSEHVTIAATSEGKCLIISGKSHYANTQCANNIIYDGSTWMMRDGPCLNPGSNHQLLFHNRSVFLIERLSVVRVHDLSLIYETSLQSLIDNDPDPWQMLKSTMPSSSHLCYSNYITLETHLSLISYDYKELRLWHYFVNSESWKAAGYAGVLPRSFFSTSIHAVKLADESLMTICYGKREVMVYKLKPKLLPSVGLSKEPSTELKAYHPLPRIKQEKAEKAGGTEKLTRSLSHLSVASSDISASGLSGVDVCGITSITISNSSLDWQWEGFGLKVHVNANTLPSGIKDCRLTISASLAGHYKFPRGDHLVSAVVWFQCEPLCKFVKPIKVELQHCACSHNAPNLNFVKALCSQKELPYVFKQVERSSFNSHCSFGVLEVNSFSGLAIVQRGSEERNYLANFLYQEEKLRPSFQLYFVITWNTITHHNIALKYFKDAKLYTKQLVIFDDQIEFQVSSNENWIVDCVNSKVVMKKHVDSFTPGETAWIPHSQFFAKFTGEIAAQVPALECVIELIGARLPENNIKLDIGYPKGIKVEYF